MKLLDDIDALLVTNPTNIRYLTGFVGTASGEREAYVLITRDEAFFLTSGLYVEEASSLQLLDCSVVKLLQTTKPLRIIEIPIGSSLGNKLSELIDTKKHVSTRISQKRFLLGFEESNLTVSELNNLTESLRGVKLVPTTDRIELLRRIKRADEIQQIELAAKITDQCFSYILKRIRPGITEARLAWEIESYLRLRAGDIAFSPIVAFNAHSSMPHFSVLSQRTGQNQRLALNSFTPLRRGSLILLDFGARVNGYCADMTRTVFLGPPKPEWASAYKTVLAAQQAALTYLRSCYHVTEHDNKSSRAGRVTISGKKADASTREIITAEGFPPYPHSLGHAVGLDVHEMPRLTVSADVTLEPGMIFSVEPGIYVSGKYGIRIEDLILLKSTRLEILSKSPKTPLVL
ncbi:Xaa-Pro peptidase family protein [Patescibacteria group bacterium]|nr:Xaa-Pro peptidase family protein [Patescibacteria group bacterium]